MNDTQGLLTEIDNTITQYEQTLATLDHDDIRVDHLVGDGIELHSVVRELRSAVPAGRATHQQVVELANRAARFARRVTEVS
ncbi:MAG TPA: hypothetical protein VK054_13215 [Beutenbergiaceae bacterium]|nr:hypothetical protein [Beutenbergiaceae bacterium]